MKRKDIFFACLFMVCFLVSAVSMAGDYLCKVLEKDWNSNHMQDFVSESFQSSESFERNTEHENLVVESTEQNQVESITSEIISTETISSETVSTETISTEDYTIETAPSEEQGETAAETQPPQEIIEQPLEFQTVGYDYFDDALLIGDSRTVGLMEYGSLENATFFADSGMSIFGLATKKISIAGVGNVTLEELLQQKQYGKIYLMLGINELGYQFDSIQKRYEETVTKIREAQPDAILYVCANLHVTQEKSLSDKIYNNDNLNRVNEMVHALADDQSVFYLDINELFDDDTGSLNKDLTSDSFHVLGKYYIDWIDWLCTKAIVLPEE